MMLFFYLLLAVQMKDGSAVPTESIPFSSWEECNHEGLIRSGDKTKQDDVKDVLYACISVDFSPADSRPHPPEPPKPARKDEAT